MKFSVFLILLFSLLISSTPFASEDPSKIQINIMNSSLNKKYIQVKDAICTKNLSKVCALAEIILESSECKKNRNVEKCAGAKEISEDASCVEGIVFFGVIDRDETMTVIYAPAILAKGR